MIFNVRDFSYHQTTIFLSQLKISKIKLQPPKQFAGGGYGVLVLQVPKALLFPQSIKSDIELICQCVRFHLVEHQ